MRRKEIKPNSILEAAIRYVGEPGLERVSTAKIATELGISEGSIFNNFATKSELLLQCLYYIDRRVDAALHEVPFQGLNFEKNANALWEAYLNYWLENGFHAKFYVQFRHSSYYTEEVIEGQNESFPFFIKLIQKNQSVLNVNSDILWTYIIETTLNFADRIIDERLPSGSKERSTMYNLLFHGIAGAFHKDSTIKWPAVQAVPEEKHP